MNPEFAILNINKPSGPTSFTISNFIKKKLNLRKTSHFGTLDPKVTGVLPIALNRACKLTGHFLGHDKTYVGIMRFHEDIPQKKVEEAIKKKFLGEITQLPPVKSRVKRAERQRTIHYFKILEVENILEKSPQITSENEFFGNRVGRAKRFSGGQINSKKFIAKTKGKDFLFETKVQGGTYIRKLIHDLGEELKIGAHMLELRRTQAGIFDESTITKLYDFEKAVDEYKKGNDKTLRNMITPAEIITEFYPVVEVKENEIEKLWTGKPFLYEYLVDKKKASKVCGIIDCDEQSEERSRVGWEGNHKAEREKVIVFSKDKFIGIYKVTNEKEIFARPEFVLQPIK